MIFAEFTGLRWGELVALRVRDVDLDTGVVYGLRKFAELQNRERVSGRPKSDAGFRTVALPSALVSVVREHLAEFPPSDPDDLIFKGPMGAALRRTTSIDRRVGRECVAEDGLPQGLRVPRSAPHRKQRWRPRRGEHTGADASDGAGEVCAPHLAISASPASGIKRLRLPSVHGLDAAVTVHGPVMARDDRIA
jgi:integrase